MSADAADITNNSLPVSFSSAISITNSIASIAIMATARSPTTRSRPASASRNLLNSAFGARFFDFDNDGWRDLLVINGHILDNIAAYHPEVTYEEEKKLYRNTGQGNFVDARNRRAPIFVRRASAADSPSAIMTTTAGRIFSSATMAKTRSSFTTTAPPQPAAKDNHWLAVQLVGKKAIATETAHT